VSFKKFSKVSDVGFRANVCLLVVCSIADGPVWENARSPNLVRSRGST